MLPDHDTMVLNILWHYADATPDERADGFAWYPDARDYAAYLANAFGIPTKISAAVIAALSPQTAWGHNKRWARQVIEAYVKGDELPNRGLGNSLKRAKTALDGDLSDINRTKGTLKVHNFFHSILGTPGYVTIDRHAARVAIGDLDWNASLTDKRYKAIADAYRDAARELRKGVRHVQAVTWNVLRRRRGIANAYQ